MFKIIGLDIDYRGSIVLGGNSVYAYSFSKPLIEFSDDDIRKFLTEKTFSLQKSKYECPLFVCTSTKSLYIDILNWYRLKNNLPLKNIDNFSGILSKVECIPGKVQPENAFIKYKLPSIDAHIWLTCPYIMKENTQKISISDISGDKLRKFGSTCSRIIRTSKVIPNPTKKTDLKRYNCLGASNIKGIGSPLVIFYVLESDASLSAELMEYATTYYGDLTIINEKPKSLEIANCTIMSQNNSGILVSRGHLYEYYDQVRSFIVDQSGNTCFIAGTNDSHNKLTDTTEDITKTVIKEFENYGKLNEYLKIKYNSKDKIQTSRLFCSNYYSDKACKNLVAVNTAMRSFARATPHTVRFFDLSTAPKTIYQKCSAYLDMDFTSVYIVNEVTDFKMLRITNPDEAFYLGKEFQGLAIIPYDPREAYTNFALSMNKKFWIPNSNLDKILPHFYGAEIFASIGTSMQACIYNESQYIYKKKTYKSDKICTGIYFDKVNFDIHIITTDDTMSLAKGSVNCTKYVGHEHLDSTFDAGSKFPITDNPANSLDEIKFYSTVACTRFQII